MKAKEYFEKYEMLLIDNYVDNTDMNARKLMLEMSEEVMTICEQRHSRSNKAFFAALKEVNQKWNVVCNLFEKKYGNPVLKRNGFLEYWKTAMPEIDLYLK